MNKIIQKEWVKRLESGDYEKGRGRLKLTNGEDKYCCLGVLADIFIDEHPDYSWSPEGLVLLSNGETSGLAYLPKFIQEWAGLSRSPNVMIEEHMEYLTTINDDLKKPKDFNHIARLIKTM